MDQSIMLQLTRADGTPAMVVMGNVTAIDAIVELNRAGEPVMLDGVPKVIGSTVGFVGGAMLRIRETPFDVRKVLEGAP